MTSTTPAKVSDKGESFAALFEESLVRKEMRQGEVITAEVVRVDANYVVVNAGLKSESYIPTEEFRSDRGEIDVQAGDFVQVAIDALEDGHGETRLSREKAKRLAAWHELESALEQGSVVQGLVNGKVKGGLTVMINGIRAFLPGSLVDLRPVKDTNPFEGKQLEFKVIKLDPSEAELSSWFSPSRPMIGSGRTSRTPATRTAPTFPLPTAMPNTGAGASLTRSASTRLVPGTGNRRSPVTATWPACRPVSPAAGGDDYERISAGKVVPHLLTDPEALSQPRRFYRVVVP